MSKGISEETHFKLCDLQEACIECGGNSGLQDHHRRFRGMFSSEESWREFMTPLWEATGLYPWERHDVQELVRLCWKCHDPLKTGSGIHGGNEKMRKKYEESYTDPLTGINIPFDKVDFKKKYASKSEFPTGTFKTPW